MGSAGIIQDDMIQLADRIRNISLGEVEVISYKMLENLGINRDQASVAIGQLIKKGLMVKVQGGFRAT